MSSFTARVIIYGVILLCYSCSVPMVETECVRNGEVRRIEVLNKSLYHLPGVFKPDVTSLFLLENTEIQAGETMLDLGTGTGIQAIFHAQRASRIVATDIDPCAVENARLNIEYHGLEEKIEIRRGDLFEPLKDGERFDVITFAPPFPRKVPKDGSPLQGEIYNDPDWMLIVRFFKGVRRYLEDGGRIFYMLGFTRNMPYLETIVEENDLVIKSKKTMLIDEQELSVFEIVPR